MTRVCGRLITPGWVFSNLLNGSLLKNERRRRRRRKNEVDLSPPVAKGTRPSQGKTNEEEDAASPLVEIPEKIKRHRRRRGERNIKLIIKLQPFLLPGSYFSLLIIHILFQ